MMPGQNDPGVTLGISFQSKRMGYVVMAGQDQLIDFGVIDFKRKEAPKILKCFREAIEEFEPDMVCFPAIKSRDCYLGETARELISLLRRECRKQKVKQRQITKSQIRNAMTLSCRSTKHDLAIKLAGSYPEVSNLLPDARKLWEAEARYMCIFTALSLVHAHVQESFPE